MIVELQDVIGLGMSACVYLYSTINILLNLPFNQAGIIIASEAGALTSSPTDSSHSGTINEAILTGRKFIVVR